MVAYNSFPPWRRRITPRPLSDGTLPIDRDDPPPLTTPPFPAPTPGSQERPGDFGPTPGLDVPNHTTFPGSNEGVGPNVIPFPKNPCGELMPPFFESDQSSGEQTGDNRFPTNPAQTKHIFRDASGHLADTLANRQLLQDTANNPDNILGTDRFGNTWASQTLPDGSQVWVRSRNGIINNGGVNATPKTFNPNTGLNRPTPPRGGN